MKTFAMRLILLLSFLSMLCSCTDYGLRKQEKQYRDSLDIYLAGIQNCFSTQNFDEALEKSYRLKDIGEITQDRKILLYAMTYIGSGYLMTERMDSMNFYYGKALPIAREENDYWALSTILNALGGDAAFGQGDYPKAIALLSEGVKYAEKIKDTSRLVLLEGNLAMVYCFINDVSGLDYALDVYEMGVKRKHDYYTFVGAMACARLYHLKHDTTKALHYIEKAIPYVEAYDPSRETYVVYADIMLDMGDEDKAVEYYEKALREHSGIGFFSKADLFLSYGEYLKSKGLYDKAAELLLLGSNTLEGSRSPSKKHLIDLNLSEIYEDKGDFRKSLEYYKKYHSEGDKLFNINKEREISRIRMEYEQQKHEMELLEWKNRFNTVVLSLLLAIALLAVLYIIRRNKEKHYRQLLRQHQAILEKQEPKTGSGMATIPQDKMQEMFDTVEKLMYEKKLYRQHDLSRDKVAQLLSTNRTYLCSVIKTFTGMSFIYYVNSFRINEAVETLSDPSDETPIKALAHNVGFNNLTTFYRLFEAAKGMPPSKYRENVLQNANLSNCKN